MTFIEKFASRFAATEPLAAAVLSLMLLATYACRAQTPSFVQDPDPAGSSGHSLGPRWIQRR